jgi:hypothetical protein
MGQGPTKGCRATDEWMTTYTWNGGKQFKRKVSFNVRIVIPCGAVGSFQNRLPVRPHRTPHPLLPPWVSVTIFFATCLCNPIRFLAVHSSSLKMETTYSSETSLFIRLHGVKVYKIIIWIFVAVTISDLIAWLFICCPFHEFPVICLGRDIQQNICRIH